MKLTENFSLKKPEQTDFYNVDDFNANAEIIDTQLKANADKASAALTASSFTGAQILSKLASAGSIIPVANGGTGAANAVTARTNLGINLGTNIYNYVGWLPNGTNLNTLGNIAFNIYGIEAEYTYTGLPDGFSGWGTLMQLGDQVWIFNVYGEVWRKTHFDSGLPWIKMIDTSNLAAQVQSLLSGGNISVIRQIIKGTVDITNLSKITVSVSLTNASKAYVILDGTSNSSDFIITPHLKTLTNTAMTLECSWASSNTYTVSYQIVEYY